MGGAAARSFYFAKIFLLTQKSFRSLASSSQQSKFRKPFASLAPLLRCLLLSRGRIRARSGNGANNAPFPSSQVGNATLWRCQESTCSPSSHKSFAPQNLCGSPIRVVPRARMCGRAAEGFALIFQVRFRSRQFSSSVKTPKLLFFRSLKTASSFPEEGDDVQCVKRGGPPKKNIPAPSSERGGTTPASENNKKTAPPRDRTEEGSICQIQL